MSKNIRKELGDNLDKMPIYVRDLKVSNKTAEKVKEYGVKNNLNNTRSYLPQPFYKLIFNYIINE